MEEAIKAILGLSSMGKGGFIFPERFVSSQEVSFLFHIRLCDLLIEYLSSFEGDSELKSRAAYALVMLDVDRGFDVLQKAIFEEWRPIVDEIIRAVGYLRPLQPGHWIILDQASRCQDVELRRAVFDVLMKLFEFYREEVLSLVDKMLAREDNKELREHIEQNLAFLKGRSTLSLLD